MERWPNFFIVGAPKAGTTSLYQYLVNTPESFIPEVKEPKTIKVNGPVKFNKCRSIKNN